LDEAGVPLRPAAALDLTEYEPALRQRNAFLKMGAPDDVTLSVWDERMSQAGGRVMARRAAVMTELAPYIDEAYQAMSGSDSTLSFSYGSEGGGSADATISAAGHAKTLAEAIPAHRRPALERRGSTEGPHRAHPSQLPAAP